MLQSHIVYGGLLIAGFCTPIDGPQYAQTFCNSQYMPLCDKDMVTVFTHGCKCMYKYNTQPPLDHPPLEILCGPIPFYKSTPPIDDICLGAKMLLSGGKNCSKFSIFLDTSIVWGG